MRECGGVSRTQAARCERSEARQGYRSGRYDRCLTTISRDVHALSICRGASGVSFETAVIERYRRRESSGRRPSSRCTWRFRAPWRTSRRLCGAARTCPLTISELNKKACVRIDWQNRPLQGGRYPCLCGRHLPAPQLGRRIRKCRIPAAIAVNEDGFREVPRCRGDERDKASWVSFAAAARAGSRRRKAPSSATSAWGCWRPWAKYSQMPNTALTAHFYRNVFCCAKIKGQNCSENAQKSDPRAGEQEKPPARRQARAVVAELRAMKLKESCQEGLRTASRRR